MRSFAVLATSVAALLPTLGAGTAEAAAAPQTPYYAAIAFDSEPSKCAGLAEGNKLKLVDCCDRSVVKFAHQRLGPYYARGYLTTPPKRGGPPESACTYMYAASGTAGKYLRLGDAKDESGDPAAEFSFFENAETDDKSEMFSISSTKKKVAASAATNCIEADRKSGFLVLRPCVQGNPAQNFSIKLYDWSSVAAVCDPDVRGKYTVKSLCAKGA